MVYSPFFMQKIIQYSVIESFYDPYTGENYQPTQVLDHNDLIEKGWANEDIARAIPSLLVKKLVPQLKESNNGKNNST